MNQELRAMEVVLQDGERCTEVQCTEKQNDEAEDI